MGELRLQRDCAGSAPHYRILGVAAALLEPKDWQNYNALDDAERQLAVKQWTDSKVNRLEPAPETLKPAAPREPAAAPQLPGDMRQDGDEGEPGQGFKNVAWWDTLPLRQILRHAAATMSRTPRALVSAVTTIRAGVCQEIDRTVLNLVATPREAEKG